MSDSTIRILLVEDDGAHVKLVRRALAAFHDTMQLDLARSLREAREILRGSHPDLLIVDLKLPDGSGMELLAGDINTTEMPVLMLTSHGDEATAVEAMKRGAIDYLVKSEEMFGGIGLVAERVRREWNHIVERRKAERSLRQSHEELRSVLNTATDFIVSIDLHGRIRYINRVMHGYNREEVIGGMAIDFIPHSGWQQFLDAFDRVRKSGEPIQFENEVLASDGSTAWFSTRLGPVLDGGEIVGFTLCASEFTERKQAEDNLRRSEQRLVNAQRVGNIGSWEWSIQDDEVWWSDQLFEMLAVAREHVIPSLNAFLKFVVAEDRHKVCEWIRTEFAGGTLHDISFRIQRSDGQIRFYASQGALECDEAGRPVRMVGTVHDVTVQHVAQTQLIRAQRLASLGTLSAGLAHEINNPMSAAWIAAETAKAIKDRPGAGEMLNECLDAIGDAVRRSQAIIENMLRFARQVSSEKQLHDLNEIVRLAVATTGHFMTTHGADIRLDLAEDLPRSMVNSAEIEQVLVNLIRNAVQAGEVTLISVSTGMGDNQVRLQVSDDGCGIPAHDLDRIFDPFFTKNDEGGTGLGLAISHSIVQDHEGKIDVESQVGRGSTFTVVLPREASHRLEKSPHFEKSGPRKNAAR